MLTASQSNGGETEKDLDEELRASEAEAARLEEKVKEQAAKKQAREKEANRTAEFKKIEAARSKVERLNQELRNLDNDLDEGYPPLMHGGLGSRDTDSQQDDSDSGENDEYPIDTLSETISQYPGFSTNMSDMIGDDSVLLDPGSMLPPGQGWQWFTY